MTRFHQYLAQRFVASVVTLLGVSLIVFLMLRLLPGDPARIIAGLLASEEDIARIRTDLGLDQPLHVQYAIFVARLARGNLGVSARTSQPVVEELKPRLASTLRLALVSAGLAAGLGVLAGTLAATRPYSGFDYTLSLATLFGVSMPVYWLGLMLIIVFAIHLNWLPAAGSEGPESIILPALTLAAFSVALIARMTRSSMLEVLRQDFVRTARAKGASQHAVIWRHALGNCMIPITTVVGLYLGILIGNSVLTEIVFSRPGLGKLILNALTQRDYTLLQGMIVIYTLMVVVVNLITDLTYGFLDPRVQYK
jgi:ABC-type dipeptide/oligopeptide/nickel transport system permease component